MLLATATKTLRLEPGQANGYGHAIAMAVSIGRTPGNSKRYTVDVGYTFMDDTKGEDQWEVGTVSAALDAVKTAVNDNPHIATLVVVLQEGKL